jgi:electron transfer flavoprotein alpha subunit
MAHDQDATGHRNAAHRGRPGASLYPRPANPACILTGVSGSDGGGGDGGQAPLRIAALVKQVPVAETLTLGPDGRLEREGMDLELNPYCRRAVSKGVELAKDSGGTCTVFTLGPPQAEDVLREAIAWGADRGVHVCDPAFAGSDTLATARALAAALRHEGPFDLVLVGRNTIDGDTGQVGPEVAELCDLPFVAGVRELARDGNRLDLKLEHDDGWQQASLELPAVLSVAERLCEPCKVPPEGRAAVDAARITRLGADDLGPGPWGQSGSPTVVGSVRTFRHDRTCTVLEGAVDDQVAEAVALLESRGALTAGVRPESGAEELTELAARSVVDGSTPADGIGRVVATLVEPDRAEVAGELAAAARRIAREVGADTVALRCAGCAAVDADRHIEFVGDPVPEDVADAVTAWCREAAPCVLLAPSTAFGREVAARVAAALGAGLVGDAIGVDVVDGVLVAAKPAFSGALVADITCTSATQLVTVRPGVLPPPAGEAPSAGATERRELGRRGRVTIHSQARDDDLEVLARAEAVIGVGTGVTPDEYSDLSPLAALLGAELAATRKATDKGWAPRSRQVGITGRSIAPRLYVAIGLSGKFNHMVGVRAAGTVLAINPDRSAPVFEHADIGIVGDWHEVVPALEAALRVRLAPVA